MLALHTMFNVNNCGHCVNAIETPPTLFSSAYTESLTSCTSDANCSCYTNRENQTIADCSFKNIKDIPSFHKSVRIIYLQHNIIEHLNNSTGKFPEILLYLDLSSNLLGDLLGNPFSNLTELLHLNISNNSLHYCPDIYPVSVFEQLENLQFLNLQLNNNQTTNLIYPLAISKLSNLTTLYLDGINERGFGVDFLALKSLRQISMSGETGFCNMRSISKDFFQYMPHLTNISMTNCSIRSIENGTFLNLTNIKYLNVSGNYRLTFKVLENITFDLKNSAIKTLDISQLHCSFGTGTMLYKQDINYLQFTNLSEFYCESNRLVNCEYGILELFPKSLSFVSVKKNRLSFGCYVFQLFNFSLKEFLADEQYLSHPFNNYKNVDCGDWRAPTLGMGHNNVDCDVSEPNVFPLPKDLEILSFQNSGNIYEIQNIVFKENKLKSLILRGNNFYSWIGPVTGLDELETLDLSYNLCRNVSPGFFGNMTTLKTLLIGNNPLGRSLESPNNWNIFKNLTKLEKLDISIMQIKELPTNILLSQHNLTSLNLSGNEISTFDLQIEHMKQLNVLDLSENRITELKKATRMQIENVPKLIINMSENVLACSCDRFEFIEWLNIHKDQFAQFETYKCSFKGKNSTFANFHDLLLDLKKSCANYTVLILTTCCCISAGIALLIAGFVYRYRWKLRYLYYISKNRSKGYMPIQDNGEQYTYDAFVSYCESEGSFVRTQLLQHLETNHQLKLCLHQRDFLPGNAIADNITGSINQSRKTIIILSKSFLKSKWCQFEYNMARMESIYSRGGEDMVVLIMYERISVKDLSSHMLAQIESDSYLEYPDNEEGLVVFWDNLYRACIN